MTYTNYDDLSFDVAIVNKKLKVCLYFRTLFQVWGFNFGTFYKEKNILLNSLAKTKHEAAELKFLETVAVIFIVMPFINARSSLKTEDVFTLMDTSPVASDRFTCVLFIWMVYSDSSGKAPGGWGFYSPLSAESSLNKNHIPMGLFVHFLVFVVIISKKKRGIL